MSLSLSSRRCQENRVKRRLYRTRDGSQASAVEKKKGRGSGDMSPLPRPSVSPGCPAANQVAPAGCRSGSLLAQFAEVLLDDLAIALRHVAGELAHVFLALTRGQLAPLLGQVLDPPGLNLTRTAVVAAVRVLHRARRLVGVAGLVALLVALAAGAVAARAVAILVVLEFLDDLVEASDDFLLELLGLLAAAGQVEPALNVVHLASNGGQVLLLPTDHVEVHQRRHHLVPLRSRRHIVQETKDRKSVV